MDTQLNSEETASTVEQALVKAGGFGRYQLLLLIAMVFIPRYTYLLLIIAMGF